MSGGQPSAIPRAWCVAEQTLQTATMMSLHPRSYAWQGSTPRCRDGRAICRSTRLAHRNTLRVTRPLKSRCTTAAMETLEALQNSQQPCILTAPPSDPESRDIESDQLVSASVVSGPNEFSLQVVPYDASQDWESRFGHYGR